jgi:hypothetical protein
MDRASTIFPFTLLASLCYHSPPRGGTIEVSLPASVLSRVLSGRYVAHPRVGFQRSLTKAYIIAKEHIE